MSEARIRRITGSLVEAGPLPEAAVYELARVGERHLLGEVIRIAGDRATLQVYEDTTGLAVGEPLQLSGESLTAHLGPGLLGSVLDGLGRRLHRLAAETGDLLRPGVEAVTLEAERAWTFEPKVQRGDQVGGGDVLGTVEERPGFQHRVLLPPGQAGMVEEIRPGPHTVAEPFGRLADGTPLRLAHRWPVRAPRPMRRRCADDRPFVTGQRIFDFLFPVAEGGTVAVPGGFGTGKTVIEQSLAKYGDADVVVYVGCGERGNEMAEVLAELPPADGSAHRPVHHGSHRHGGEYLQHAGGRTRVLGLPGRHPRRVLPGHGLPGGGHGGQPLALGRSAPRDQRATAGDARRGRLSHLSLRPARPLLRAGGISSSTFYDPDKGRAQRWSDRGVLGVEMEAAILFTIAALRRVQAACFLTVSDIIVEGEFTAHQRRRAATPSCARTGRVARRARAALSEPKH